MVRQTASARDEGHRPARPLRDTALRLLDWTDGHRTLVLGLLFVLYCAIALIHNVPRGNDDEGGYLTYAQALIDGRYGSHSPPGEFLHWGPGLPILLAPFTAAHVPLEVTRIIFGPGLLTLVTWILWTALRPEVGRRGAALAALLCGLYWPAWISLGMVLSEEPTALMLTLALWAWLSARRSRSLPLAALAGLSLGYAALIRVEFGWVVVAGLVVSTVLLVVRRGEPARRAFIASLIAMVVCVPWLAYTHDQSGNTLYWGTSGGQNLYWTAASKPPFQGEWVDVRAAFDNPNYRPFWPQLREWERLDPPAQDAAYQQAAVKAIKADPTVFVVNMGKGVTRMVVNLPFSFETVSVKRVGLTIFYGVANLLVLAAVVTVVVLLTRRRRWAAIASAPVFVVGLNLLEHLPLAALPRHLLPVMPPIIWFVVAGWLATRLPMLRQEEKPATLPDTPS
jgi:hypothetical protein